MRCASVSNPFRMSVAPEPRKTFTVEGQLSMIGPPERPRPDGGCAGQNPDGPRPSGRSARRSRSEARDGARPPPGPPAAPAGRPGPVRWVRHPGQPGSLPTPRSRGGPAPAATSGRRPSFNPSRSQKARTVSPLRCCCRLVRRQNFYRMGSRCLPPRLAMLGSPRYRCISSRRPYRGHQDGVRKAHTKLACVVDHHRSAASGAPGGNRRLFACNREYSCPESPHFAIPLYTGCHRFAIS